jgi:raffinose/stachyose/melibiose transport system permease protein
MMPTTLAEHPRAKALPPVGPTAGATRARRSRWRGSTDLLFMIPALTAYIVVIVYPMLRGAVYAFTNWNGLKPDYKYVGWANFIRLATDSQVRSAISTTLTMAVALVVLQTTIGLGLALALDQRLHSKNLLRTLFFMPVVLTPVVVSFVWQYLLSPQGPVNLILAAIGLGAFQQDWLGNPNLAVCSVIALTLWQSVGIAMVILLAGLQGVPRELVEAAQIDGASPWQRFRHIVLPLLAPAITITVVLALIHGLKFFDQVYVLTGGGPGYATETLSTIIYKTSFQFAESGYGSAIALVFSILVGLLVVATTHVLRQREMGDA